MEPLIMLIEPWEDPENTFRASSVSQMYDVTIDRSLNFSYSVGISPNIDRFFVKFRNKTVNTDLSVRVILPKYIRSTYAMDFIVNRNTTFKFGLDFNEPFVKEYTKKSISSIFEDLEMQVFPVKVIEPAFVRKDLPSLTDS